MNKIENRTFYYLPVFTDFIKSGAMASLVFGILSVISYSKTSTFQAEPVVIFLSLIFLASPVLGILKHRRYQVVIKEGEIEGYSFNSKKRISRNIDAVKSFGIMKSENRLNPRKHFAMVDHPYISFENDEIEVLLNPSESKEFLTFLSHITGKKQITRGHR